MKMLHLVLIVLPFLINCVNQKPEKNKLGQITLSPNDEYVLFSYSKNDVSSLYLLNLANRKVQSILSSETKSFTVPKYSSDGEKIIFIGHDKGSITGNVYIADTNGSNIEQVTIGESIITEAIFSSNGEMIYFIKASEYDKYSPIGVRAAHNYDVYSLKLGSKKEIKLTNKAAYRMSNISYVENGEYIILELFEGPNGGISIFKIENPDSIRAIIPSNNPREGLYSFYGNPIYSKDFSMLAFTAPYELYIMSFSDKVAKKVYRDTGHIDQVTFFSKQQKLLFTVHGKNLIRSVNFDGSMLGIIQINLPN